MTERSHLTGRLLPAGLATVFLIIGQVVPARALPVGPVASETAVTADPATDYLPVRHASRIYPRYGGHYGGRPHMAPRGGYRGGYHGGYPGGTHGGHHGNYHGGYHGDHHNDHHHNDDHHHHGGGSYWPGYGLGWGWGLGYGGYYGGYDNLGWGDYYQEPYYRYQGSHTLWCQSRYRSYDPVSDTFLGYDGRRHYCRGP